MANFIKRFTTGFKLTDQEILEKKEVEEARKDYFSHHLSSVEFHPTFCERVRRGVRYVLKPEEMRAE